MRFDYDEENIIIMKGQIHVNTENIFPIIKKFLYSDHEIFLRELVSNAVDASQKLKTLSSLSEFKGELGEMKVVVKLDKEKKTITISDNGIGMTAKQVEQVLADSPIESASHQLPGSHLGLSIVNRIVKLHNGEIQVESTFGQGTIFTFTVTPG